MENEILKSAQHVFDVMKSRVTPEELQRIKDSFNLAAEAHKDQKRQTGQPYIIHPIAVATIAAEELLLDANSVCACFLHDVVEDTPYSIEDIRSRFGDDVAFLVNVVTKKKKVNYALSKQIDNYRQILQSVDYDIRALLVKLSDRLHNMRTLGSMRPEKQMKIAGETDFFYAPLAGRLGLYNIKSELENLSFAYRCPDQYNSLAEKLKEEQKSTSEELRLFTDEIAIVLSDKGIDARVDIRYRRPYSIWRDMMEKKCFDFDSVVYKQYVRVTFTHDNNPRFSEKDMAFLNYSILSSCFNERPGSVRNYIDNPKSNGYQGLHVTLLDRAGVWQEVHIASEGMRRKATLGCVVDRGEGWLDRLRKELKDIAKSDESATLFMQGLKTDLYNEDIICFTPKGKGIILPKGATVLDFAFELHTELGYHAKYAIVNGNICPVSQSLNRGDCVQIITSDEISPQPSWLKITHSFKSQKCVREAMKHIVRLPYDLCDLCNPIPGEEVIGIKNESGRVLVHKKNCSRAILAASGSGDNIVPVNLESHKEITFPVNIGITSIDRYHLLRDIIDCFVENQHISVDEINSVTNEQIVTTKMRFNVCDLYQLNSVLHSISLIPGVVSVLRLEEK